MLDSGHGLMLFDPVHIHAQATGKGDDTSPLQLITEPKSVRPLDKCK